MSARFDTLLARGLLTDELGEYSILQAVWPQLVDQCVVLNRQSGYHDVLLHFLMKSGNGPGGVQIDLVVGLLGACGA